MNEVNDIDRMCIRQVLSGRKEAYALLVDCYGRDVFRLVASMVPLKEDAEEPDGHIVASGLCGQRLTSAIERLPLSERQK